MQTQKLILTDADGVLFDWGTGFSSWMQEMGYVLQPDYQKHYRIEQWFDISNDLAMELVGKFNSSGLSHLGPYLDSVEYVKKLHKEHGYKFIVITAMGTDWASSVQRTKNLENVFGDIFEDLRVVPLLTSKLKILQEYSPTIWIEDKPSNAEDGVTAGHRTYMFEHGHNDGTSTSHAITRVNKWEEIYNSIVSEEGLN